MPTPPAHKNHGNGLHYLVGRIKRDRPDIGERLAKGEFASAREAARAAGIAWAENRPPKPWTQARQLLRWGEERFNAVMEEVEILRAEIAGVPPDPDLEFRSLVRRYGMDVVLALMEEFERPPAERNTRRRGGRKAAPLRS